MLPYESFAMSVTTSFRRCGSLQVRAYAFLVLSLLGLAGCGGTNPLSGATLYPVKGKVLLADGKPLTSGQVVFVATKSTITSAANIESDGAFSFKGASGAGLPEGEYRVRIEPGSSTPVVKGSRGALKANLPFDGKYLDEDGSDLKATVTPDESKNNFEFKLARFDPAAQSKNTRDSRGQR
jgi:hypothetical protein